MAEQHTVLFLCTENSARSQMAEAIVNHRMADEWKAFSAGIHPSGFVHPMAIQALKEIGIDHTGRSKSTEEFRNMTFDLVVTVCDSAAEECPVWLGKGVKTHLSFPDPAAAPGTEEEKLEAFRSTRDEIAAQMPILLKDALSPQLKI